MFASAKYRFTILTVRDVPHTLVMSTPWHIKARKLAKDRGLSYQEMADRLGVSKAAVGHWMSGRHDPSLPRLQEIATMLETSLSDLVAEDDRFMRNEDEVRAVKSIREMPEDYRAQALAMLEAFRLSIPSGREDKH